MKALVLYFSGSGNTEYVAKRISDVIEQKDYEVTVQSIENTISVPEFDLLVIGGPIYNHDAPRLLKKWINKNLPDGDDKKVITFTTSASDIKAHGADNLAVQLLRKGYNPIGAESFTMPNNFYFTKYENQTRGEKLKRIDETSGSVEEIISADLVAYPGISPRYHLIAAISAPFYGIYTRILGNKLSSGEECIKCLKCINDCPVHNIKLVEGKIVFKNSCIMCTRCIHSCTVNCISFDDEIHPQYKLKNFIK